MTNIITMKEILGSSNIDRNNSSRTPSSYRDQSFKRNERTYSWDRRDSTDRRRSRK